MTKYESVAYVLGVKTNQIKAKEIGDEKPCYSTKISIFSFIWAGLAALHESKHNIMKVVQS